jgi:hypothetical protein
LGHRAPPAQNSSTPTKLQRSECTKDNFIDSALFAKAKTPEFSNEFMSSIMGNRWQTRTLTHICLKSLDKNEEHTWRQP